MTLLTDFVQSGGGYGDPLERNPETVARDFRIGATSIEMARQVYGVVLDPSTLSAEGAKTDAYRKEIRETRVQEGQRLSPPLLDLRRARQRKRYLGFTNTWRWRAMTTSIGFDASAAAIFFAPRKKIIRSIA